MKLGVPKDMRLTSAKKAFLLNCKAAGLRSETAKIDDGLLNTFIKFTADMLVRNLSPDHVRMYLAELSTEHDGRAMTKRDRAVRGWIRWMYAQKFITDRVADFPKPARLR